MRILSIAAVLFFLSLFVEAINTPTIIINEIAWMGTPVEGVESKNWWRYEWLELYNNTENSVSLENWKIELYRDNLDWVLELKGTILPKSYFLIVSSDKIFPNYDLNYSNLGGKFINSGHKVLLKDANNQIVDEIDCSSNWFAGDNSSKKTMERKNPQLPGNSTNWGTSQNPGGTPKAENDIFAQIGEVGPEPKPQLSEFKNPQTKEIIYPAGVVINEILPSPVGSDETEEWIEILNQNNFEVDTSDWQIADTVGKTAAYAFPAGTKISSQGFLVLLRPATKITLNNSGDGLNLIQPDGKVKDSVTYEKAVQGQSFSRVGSTWSWGSSTPGKTNISSIPTKQEKAIAKEQPNIKEVASNPLPEKSNLVESEKGLAAIGEQIPDKITFSFFTALIGLSIAIFSGFVILLLKKRL